MRLASRGEYVCKKKKRKHRISVEFPYVVFFLKSKMQLYDLFVSQCTNQILQFLEIFCSLLHLFNFESVNIINKTHRINTNIDSLVVFNSIHACTNAKFTFAFIRSKRSRMQLECQNLAKCAICQRIFKMKRQCIRIRPVSNTIFSMELFCI